MAAKNGVKKAEIKSEKTVAEETVFISDADMYVYGQGSHYDIYKKLGAHPSVEDGKEGYFFATWAPNAQAVYVVGDFNAWDEWANPCKKIGEGGIQ